MPTACGAGPGRHAARAAAWCLLALQALAPLPIQAADPLPETPLFESFGTSEGLPASKLYALAQDREGYLWIGSIDGLARYDGTGFEVFRHDSADPKSLAGNNVQALHVDDRGRLWLGSEGGGLSLLEDAHRGRFRHFNRSTDARIQAEDVFSIRSDRAGSIWFGGFNTGLYRLDPERGVVERHGHDSKRAGSLPADTVLSLLRDREDRMWVGTTAGVCRWDAPSFSCYLPPTDGVRGHWVWSLAEASDGGLHVGTGETLWRLHPERAAPDQFERVEGIASASVTAMLDEGEGHFWLGQSSGLSSRQGDVWRRHPARPGQRFTFPGKAVWSILRDHEDGLWFATDGGGLARLSPSFRDFSVFRHQPELGGALPLGLAAARDGGLWLVGQSPNVEHLDLARGELRSAFEVDGLPGTKLRSVLELADGSLWLGHGDGLVIRTPAGSERRFSPSSAQPVPSGELDHLLETEEGVWVGVVGAALQLRDRRGELLLDLRGDGEGGIDSVETEQLQIAPDGALWWAGANGLRRRAPGGEFAEVPGAPGDRVFGLVFGTGGSLWLHRLQGLERYRWDGAGLQLVDRLGASAGVPEVESAGPLIDAQGDVWLPTIRGLFRYRAASADRLAELRQYRERDGLPSAEFRTRQSALQLPHGQIAALTLGGVVAFDPLQLRDPQATSPLHWASTSVLRAGRRIDLPEDLIELGHDDRDLRLSLRLLSFADPGANRYRYQLEGIDPGWIEVGASPERSYARLPAGEYRLRGAAAAADGRWVAAAERRILVRPPPWATPWAFAAYVLLAALLAWIALLAWRRRLMARLQLRVSEQAHRQAQAASEAKGRFLATLGHEVRTPMAGLLGMNALLLESALSPEQRRQAQAVRRAGRMMLRLLNEALDLARIEAGRLELLPQTVDLPRLLAELIELEQPLAEAKGLRLTLAIAPRARLRVEVDPLRLQQILLNLLGNALKFTDQGGVHLTVERVDGDPAAACALLRMTVQDSGRGLDANTLSGLFQPFTQAEGARTAQQHGGSGLGLSISRQLAEAMGGRIEAESSPGQGSRFWLELELPVLGAADSDTDAEDSADISMPAAQGLLAEPPRVLLVEDHRDVAEALAGLMRRWGCEVCVASHGLQAMAEVEHQRFDLALLDLDLPGIDGFELARLLRGQVPRLLALTARSDPESEQRALAAGFDQFLRKPIESGQLRSAIAPSRT